MESNPAFYIELERAKTDLADCVMPNHPFKKIVEYRSLVPENPKLARKLAEAEIKKSKDYDKVVGMGLDIVVSPSILSRVLTFEVSPDIVLYFCKAKKTRSVKRKLERIASLEIRALEKRSLNLRLKISEVEGTLLGYPKCCISKFVELKKKSFFGESPPPETATIMECLESDFFGVLRFFSRPSDELPQEFFAFFTSNFYPCTVECERAISIGRRLYELLNPEKRRILTCKLILNVLNVLLSAYNAYLFVRERGAKTEFGKAVLEFFDKLSQEEIGTLDRISKTIAMDPLKFENDYISMHLD